MQFSQHKLPTQAFLTNTTLFLRAISWTESVSSREDPLGILLGLASRVLGVIPWSQISKPNVCTELGTKSTPRMTTTKSQLVLVRT